MSALLRAYSNGVRCLPTGILFGVRNFHACSRFFNASSEENSSSPPNLSEALKLNTKFRVSKKELKNLDNEDAVNYKRKVQKFMKEINEVVLDPEVKKYQKNEPKPLPHATSDNTKKNEKIPYDPKARPKLSPLGKLIRQSQKFDLENPYKFTDHPLNIVPRRERYTFNPKSSDVASVGELDTSNIPRLAHKLDRTLFSPGVHFLQDPRTRIYNFSPYLKNIIKYEDFNFDLVEKFVTVSKDNTLLNAAIENGKKFYSSTSSMTSTLTQFYLFLNNYDHTNTTRFNFPKFTRTVRTMPSSFLVSPKGKNPVNGETIYSVESDKSTDQEILLSAMGHCLEALLTNEESEFSKYDLRFKTDKVMKFEEERINENSYNYATYGKFLMRSQLDCYDDRLPGNGTFDLKSRAVCSIRYDQGNPNLAENTYQIWKLNGEYESFEKEYTDLIRLGALLKYGFQARIGQMDGIFVAYHNINSFFGFQYLPLSEIDNVFYSSKMKIGTKNINSLEDMRDNLPSFVADEQFKISIDMWEKILESIIADMEQYQPFKSSKPTFRVVMKSLTDGFGEQKLRILAIPLSKEHVKTLQNFPKSFKTSFREDIQPVERFEHLKKHQQELQEFNESTVFNSEIGVLNYEVDAKFVYKNSKRTKSLGSYNVTSGKDDQMTVQYNIRSLPRSPRIYLALLKSQTDLLTQGFEIYTEEAAKTEEEEEDVEDDAIDISETERENAMRVYSAVGKVRAKIWEEKDNNPVIYEPKEGKRGN